jgi:hypothetical protein
MMLSVDDTVEHWIPHIHIEGVHVDLGSEDGSAIFEYSLRAFA